ncbi:hypothetical protein CEE45_01715 [Candidatus Heimdallarchaeota archaeon B3_Heim]|nr:MAG: hypothetical protein CEE45_01715 [Candidatus Heimdallarchaeota archaeon B3_Heim]
MAYRTDTEIYSQDFYQYYDRKALYRPYLQFNGSFMYEKSRLSTLHNQIMKQDLSNYSFLLSHIGFSFTEFFPRNHIDFIVQSIIHSSINLRGKNAKHLIPLIITALTLIFTHEDKYLPDQVIKDLDQHFPHVDISKTNYVSSLRLIQQCLPSFYQKYPLNRKQEFLNCMKYCLTLLKKNGETKQEIVNLHTHSLALTKQFFHTKKFKHLKPHSYESVAQAIISLATNTRKCPFPFSRKKYVIFSCHKSQLKKLLFPTRS